MSDLTSTEAVQLWEMERDYPEATARQRVVELTKLLREVERAISTLPMFDDEPGSLLNRIRAAIS